MVVCLLAVLLCWCYSVASFGGAKFLVILPLQLKPANSRLKGAVGVLQIVQYKRKSRRLMQIDAPKLFTPKLDKPMIGEKCHSTKNLFSMS